MNIILLVVDALRHDCLGNSPDDRFLKKYHVDKMLNNENMKVWANDGISFNNVISTSVDTPSAHGSLFTGNYPHNHNIRSFFHNKLSRNVKTIFEIMSDNGYETVAVTDKLIYDKILELTRGCSHVIDHYSGDDLLFNLLENMGGENIFLYQRFMDVHFPYFVPDNIPNEDYLKTSYDEALSICDRYGTDFILKDGDYNNVDNHENQWLSIKKSLKNRRGIIDILVRLYIKGINKFDSGRFKYYMDNLTKIGMLDDCILIITSDHGESVIRRDWVEDGYDRFDHCFANVDDLTRIPLVFWGNEINSCVIDRQVRIIDILPTILKMADIEVPIIDGVDLFCSNDLPAYSEHYWWNDGRYKNASDFKNLFDKNNFEGSEKYSLLRHRAVRMNGYRYVELGERWIDDDWNVSMPDFIRSLFRKYVVDWYDENRINEIVGCEHSKLKMEEKLRKFAESNNKCALYDLSSDPFEEVNLLNIDFKKYKEIVEVMRRKMDGIIENSNEIL